MAGRSALGIFDHLRSDHIICNDIATRRLDLEGISLNGLMVQKILRDTQKSTDVSQLTQAIASLATQIEALALEAADLKTQYTQISSQLTTVQDTLASLSATIASNDEFIQKAKQATFFVGPFE